MDRPKHTTAVRNLLALAGGLFSLIPAGCKSTKSEVPPEDRTRRPVRLRSVGFSSDAHPSTAGGMAGLYGNKGPGSFAQDVQNSTAPSRDITYGMPAPGATNLGAPTDNRYGRSRHVRNQRFLTVGLGVACRFDAQGRTACLEDAPERP